MKKMGKICKKEEMNRNSWNSEIYEESGKINENIANCRKHVLQKKNQIKEQKWRKNAEKSD